MSQYLKVKHKKHLYRDPQSKCIINTDSKGLKKAKELKARINKREEEIQDLKQTVKNLELLVLQLVEERNGNS
jgi:hypothetical protein